MSVKKRVFDALQKTGIPASYAVSTSTTLPKIVFDFVSNVSTRLSNQKHTKYYRYQIIYYSDRALDVEKDATLRLIEDSLDEAGLIVTDWMERTDIDTDDELSSYSYLIEVIG